MATVVSGRLCLEDCVWKTAILGHASLNLPDSAHDPSVFMEMTLGIDWIDNLEAQAFFIQYINQVLIN